MRIPGDYYNPKNEANSEEERLLEERQQIIEGRIKLNEKFYEKHRRGLKSLKSLTSQQIKT